MTRLLERKPVGCRLWGFTAGQVLGYLRMHLGRIACDRADQYTLKTFRAGRATALAAKGVNLRDILRAGEWRSAAFLRYVGEDAVDASTFLNQIYELSDKEEE